MADVGTFFSEENIKIIENIFKPEFEKQEKNITNIISASQSVSQSASQSVSQSEEGRKEGRG